MSKINIGIIGLGYVGLPLAHLFSKSFLVTGYDNQDKRIRELKKGIDSTHQLSKSALKELLHIGFENKKGLSVTNDITELQECNVYIVTVPTPVNKYKQPDLSSLRNSTKEVALLLKKGDLFILESTVYPGATEEVCVPILENISGLTYNKDFFVGYSPERINPGDEEHTIDNIKKITSGSTVEVAAKVDELYSKVIKAGTFKVSSIKVAEAAKVIENTQRDINIALINELAKIFHLIGIDTNEVLKAAGTKWNFLKFYPGLVGGHCIGVDPYYLAYKAIELNYYPEIILAGRRINDSMGTYVSRKVIELMMNKNIYINKSQVLILGATFKENIPDFRNTLVVDIVKEFEKSGSDISVYDPWINPNEFYKTYAIKLHDVMPKCRFDAIILAVPHSKFKQYNFRKQLKKKGVLFDVKGFLNEEVDGKL